MKTYVLVRHQQLRMSLDEAWNFFSSPVNLKTITPDYMGFEITSDLGDGKMYTGQMISYIVKPVLGIPMRWVTEIKHVEDRKYFVDEQRSGPYKIWHHEHHFETNADGVLMTDRVTYGLPLGILGRIANTLFVEKQLDQIFNYRTQKVEELFTSVQTA